MGDLARTIASLQRGCVRLARIAVALAAAHATAVLATAAVAGAVDALWPADVVSLTLMAAFLLLSLLRSPSATRAVVRVMMSRMDLSRISAREAFFFTVEPSLTPWWPDHAPDIEMEWRRLVASAPPHVRAAAGDAFLLALAARLGLSVGDLTGLLRSYGRDLPALVAVDVLPRLGGATPSPGCGGSEQRLERLLVVSRLATSTGGMLDERMAARAEGLSDAAGEAFDVLAPGWADEADSLLDVVALL